VSQSAEKDELTLATYKPAPPGWRWVFTPHRKTKTGKVLWASEYGYECWAFLVRG